MEGSFDISSSVPVFHTLMSDYHNTHWHIFYQDLSFSARVPLAVNCYMFDALSRWSNANADLFFCTGCCSCVKWTLIKVRNALFGVLLYCCASV
jgi:hypothetical protein